MPEAAGQGFEELLTEVYATGKPFFARELSVYLLRNGTMEKTYINFTYQPYYDDERNIKGVLVFCNEVTAEVLARQQLEVLIEKLKATNARLEEFSYAASHDMKEPIRKIKIFSGRLKKDLKEKLNDSESLVFDRMESSVSRMGNLIDDLLACSQTAEGFFELKEINLNQKVKLVLEDLELEIQEKNAKINSHTLPVIKGNRREFQQLFQNLISNALKYSKPDITPEVVIFSRIVEGKEVKVNLPLDEGNKRFHLIEVRDNGIGFEQAYAERIFNVFTRLHSNTKYKGTGLGLSIVRKVVENHHGYDWASSEPGQGSTFKVLIPIDL